MARCPTDRVTTRVVVVVVVVLLVVEVLRCDKVRADVVTFGQPYDASRAPLMSNLSRTVLLVHEAPEAGMLYQMAAYFMTRQSMILQVWRPTGNGLEFELTFARQYSVDTVNRVKVLDTVIDPTRTDPECPQLEAGDWLGLYSSGQVPIPYYSDPRSGRVFRRTSNDPPTVGQKLVFQELGADDNPEFVVEFALATEDNSQEIDSRRPQHGRRRTGQRGYARMCFVRNRDMPMRPSPRPPGVSTLRPNGDEMPMAPSPPPLGVSTLRPNGDVMASQQSVKPSSPALGGSTLRPNGDDADGIAGEDDAFYDEYENTEKRSRKGKLGSHGKSGLSAKEMYIIIGSLAFVVVGVVVTIIVCVACRRNKRQAEPRSPVRSVPLDGAILRMSKHISFLGDSPIQSPESRYTSDGRLRPRIQKTDNEYLDLSSVDKPPDEVYEEIFDQDAEDLNPGRRRLPLPEKPDPSGSPSAGARPPGIPTRLGLNPERPGSTGSDPGRTGRNSGMDRSPRIEPSRGRNAGGSGSPRVETRTPSTPGRPYSTSGSRSPRIEPDTGRIPSGSVLSGIDPSHRQTSIIGSRPQGIQNTNNEHTYLSLVG